MPGFTLTHSFSDIDAQRQNITQDAGVMQSFGTELGRGIARGFLNVGSGLVGTTDFLIPGRQKSLEGIRENIQSKKQDITQEYGNWAGWAGRVIGEALPYMGSALVGGYAGAGLAGGAGAGLTGQAAALGAGLGAKGATTGALLGAASVGFAVEGQQAYDDAIAGGASENEANAERLIVGTINAAIEASQIGRLMKFHKTGSLSLGSFIRNVRNGVWDQVGGDAKKFTGQVLKTALEEGLEEAAQEGVSVSVPGFMRGDIKRKPDGSVDWGYVVDRIGGAFVGGAFAGGVLGGAGALVGASPEIGKPNDTDIDSAIERIDGLDISNDEKVFWKHKLEQYRVKNKEKDDVSIASEVSDATETKAPETQLMQQGLNKDYDGQLVDAVNEMDTSLREEHIEQIKKEKGKRIASVKEIFKDQDMHPMLKFQVVKEGLSGELGLRFDPIQMDENQIAYYYQRVAIAPELKSFERLAAGDGLNAVFGLYKDSKGQGKLPEPNQIKQLEKVFGPELAESLVNLRGDTRKVSSKIIESLNLPRALLASFDVSAGGRQGLLLMPIAPKQWFKAVGQGYKAWTSPEYADYIDMQIKTDEYYSKFRDSDGFLAQVGGLTSGEEIFASKWAKAIPGIKASERAYTTTLNSLRFYTFKKYASKWAGTGKTDVDYKMLAKFINHATGRGDIKGLEEFAPFLNAAFFAPRLQMGRIQSIGDLFKGAIGDIKSGQFSPTRKIIAADLISSFAGGMGILALLSKMKGVTVEEDPRSSDFGKIRFGNTRIDFWGGYSQIARFTAQLITSESKGTDSGRVMAADRGNIIWRFLQTKLSPAAGLSVDLLRGETFLGKQLEGTPEAVTQQMYERLTPLFVQDVVDAARYQGLTSASIVAPLAVHGIGAMTYPTRPSTAAMQLKESSSREVFGKSWDELGNLAQKYLKQQRPEIEISERKARSERENFDTVARGLEEQRKVMNKIVDKLPPDIQKEINTLDIYIPGLSRYIANGWYLNDKRYKDYQGRIEEGMKLYLGILKKSSLWNSAPPEMKASLMEEVINAIKKQVKDNLLQEVTIKDIQQIKRS